MKKNTYRIAVILLVIIVLIVPIPRTEAKDGFVKTYQSLTYKIVSYVDDGYKTSKVFFFPNNFKSAEELLLSAGIDIKQETGGEQSSTGQGSLPGSEPEESEGVGETEIKAYIEKQLKELGEIAEGETDMIKLIPEESFTSKVFSCNLTGAESGKVIIIRTKDDLKKFLGGTNYFGEANGQCGGDFLQYVDALQEDYFKNRALILTYYSIENVSKPEVVAIANLKGHLVVGALTGKVSEGQTDSKGFIISVDIEQKNLENVNDCKFMVMPTVERPGIKPLGGDK